MPVPRTTDISRTLASRRGLALLALVLGSLTGCGASSSGEERTQATAAPAPLARVPSAPPVTPVPAPEPGSPRPAGTPAAAAAPNVRHLTAAPASAPPVAEAAILSVATSSNVVHAGDSVLWTVRTTPDIVSVTASTPLYRLAMNRQSPGLFRLTFGIPPNAPPLFHGNYTLSIVATSADGREAYSSLPMAFQ